MIEVTMLPAPFNELPPNSITRLSVAKGATAFRQGDAARGPYFVESGSIELVRHTEAGNLVILHRAQKGQMFAEASLFSQNYHCDCVAIKDSRLIRFDKPTILEKMHGDGPFAFQLMKDFAAQIQGYRRNLELFAIKGANDRVLAALSQGQQDRTIMAFAASIGLSHEATYRALSNLVKLGLVEQIGRGRYQVSNAAPK